MQRKIKSTFLIVLLLIVFVPSTFSGSLQKTVRAAEPFFTLVALGRGNSTDEHVVLYYPDPAYFMLLQQQLVKIGISLEVVLTYDMPYTQALLASNFDLCPFEMFSESVDPADLSFLYEENGSLNLWGYDTSMDWNETLGTGENEWYLQRGAQMLPPYSEERVQHYWAWEQYLMDKLLPIIPTFTSKQYEAYWSSLEGYDIAAGVLQSWGKMFWSGPHPNQTATDELVIADRSWADLNPLSRDYFQEAPSSLRIGRMIMEPLIWYDPDKSVWPHLAASWELLNDTHVRIHLREGVKWQPDPEGLFLNESFTAEDVYFTFYCWKQLAKDRQYFAWLEKLAIVDNSTIDFYIDGNPETPENEPYAEYLQRLAPLILPEHYLNQTQEADGTTPDITHPSWNRFSSHCFGTGILAFDFRTATETQLVLFDDCWKLDGKLLTDPNLDWARRLGEKWELARLRIKTGYHVLWHQEFAWGNIDLREVYTTGELNKTYFLNHPDFAVQSKLGEEFAFFWLNMHENRNTYLCSRAPCPNDPTISIGLAIRKAIAYAIDREAINDEVHEGERGIHDLPINPNLGIWCTPDIIQYNYDLAKAKEYMAKAGFNVSTLSPSVSPPTIPTPGFERWVALVALTIIATVTVVMSKKGKKRDK